PTRLLRPTPPAIYTTEHTPLSLHDALPIYTVASAPPATITSASPYSMSRPASPMLCRPVVQAVTIERFGPLSPYMIDSWPEIMLMIEPGTKNGDMRRTPRLRYSAWVSSIRGSPPMPEP